MKHRNETIVKNIEVTDLDLVSENVHYIDMELTEYLGYMEIPTKVTEKPLEK